MHVVKHQRLRNKFLVFFICIKRQEENEMEHNIDSDDHDIDSDEHDIDSDDHDETDFEHHFMRKWHIDNLKVHLKSMQACKLV